MLKGIGKIKIGENVLIRTKYLFLYTGRLVEVTPSEVTIEDAAWVADTGRWHTFLRKGTASEVEPEPEGPKTFCRQSIAEIQHWRHELLREVL